MPSPTTDLLILGGGVIGLACAREILRREPELRLTIIDAPTGAMPASVAAAGMLAPWAEFPERSPLADWCEESYRLYDAFARELVEDTGMPLSLLAHGTLIPCLEETEERWIQRVDCYRERGIAFELLEGAELLRAEPRLAPSIARGILLPEAIINPRRLHAALHADVTRRGVIIETGHVTGFDVSQGRLTAARLEDGRRLEVNTVLIATGSWTSQVAELAGVDIDVTPIKGQVLALEAPDGFLHRVVHTKAVYLAPRPGAGIVVGATMEDVGFAAGTDAATLQYLRERAAALVPESASLTMRESWSGFRPRPRDGMPVLGWAPGRENLLLATGHFRNGILLTPFTARFMARAFTEGRTPATTYGNR